MGICDGISAYAWHKDGSTFVGTTGKLLRDAIEDAVEREVCAAAGAHEPLPRPRDAFLEPAIRSSCLRA